MYKHTVKYVVHLNLCDIPTPAPVGGSLTGPLPWLFWHENILFSLGDLLDGQSHPRRYVKDLYKISLWSSDRGSSTFGTSFAWIVTWVTNDNLTKLYADI